MTWEFIQGKSKEDVIKTMYPIIGAHFQDKNKSESTFKEMLYKGHLIKSYSEWNGEQKFNVYDLFWNL